MRAFTREHRLLWSTRFAEEHTAVMAECKRVTEIGGSFEIVNRWHDSNWYSFVTVHYPKTSEEQEQT